MPTIEEELLKILLNKSRTKAFLKRVKQSNPNEWLRVFGNIYKATEELRLHRIEKSFFYVGVWDSEITDAWPWSIHIEDGIYLSEKRRMCKITKAFEFQSPEAARLFFHDWKGKYKYKYKCEIVELKKWVDVPFSEMLDNSPSFQLSAPSLKTTDNKT